MLVAKVMVLAFFGTLRAAEVEHLIEKLWYTVTETCLSFTVFRDDFSPRFVAQFTVLLMLKGFHWLAEDRIDYVCLLISFLIKLNMFFSCHLKVRVNIKMCIFDNDSLFLFNFIEFRYTFELYILLLRI